MLGVSPLKICDNKYQTA